MANKRVFCEWRQIDDYTDDGWTTSCEKEFCLTDGTPEQNGMEYCCFCGKKIRQIKKARG